MSIVDRVNLTSSCKDCDVIEKYSGAGEIFEDENGKFQFMFNGIKIYYDSYHSPWMNEIIYNLKGHHEPQEEICFYNILLTLSDDSKMLELGSNWSYYTMWFSKQIKNSFNVCIEPVHTNLIKGKENANLNNCKNIEFLLGCIGDSYKDNFEFINWDGDKMIMNKYSINSIIENYKCFFDIIHSDIQGLELEMLNGSLKVLDNIGYFVISTHGNLHQHCIDFLEKNNFEILLHHTIDESFSGDGLIIAVNNINRHKYEKNIGISLTDFFKKILISRK